MQEYKVIVLSNLIMKFFLTPLMAAGLKPILLQSKIRNGLKFILQKTQLESQTGLMIIAVTIFS